MNEKNLIQNSGRSRDEVKKVQSKGGINSGKSRRHNSDIKQKMKVILALPAAANYRELLEAIGVDPDDADNEMVLAASMFREAADGNVKALEKVLQLIGKDIEHEELALKKKELRMKEKAASESDNAALAKLDEVLGKIEGGF